MKYLKLCFPGNVATLKLESSLKSNNDIIDTIVCVGYYNVNPKLIVSIQVYLILKTI